MAPPVLLADVALPCRSRGRSPTRSPTASPGARGPGRASCARSAHGAWSGVVLAVREGEPPPHAKSVAQALDEEPAVPQDLLAFLRDLAAYYFAPIGEVVRLALPPVDRDTARELAEPSLFGEAQAASARGACSGSSPTARVEEAGTLRGQARRDPRAPARRRRRRPSRSSRSDGATRARP